MLNRVVLIGRLTRDPALRYTPSGTAVGDFTLAVDRPRPDVDGRRQADFIDVVVWQKRAEVCHQNLVKGRLVAVEGRLQVRSYEDKQGVRRRVAEVVAESVRFLDRPKNGERGQDAAGAAGQAAEPFGEPVDLDPDDLPF